LNIEDLRCINKRPHPPFGHLLPSFGREKARDGYRLRP
jgi:hypothetical protein